MSACHYLLNNINLIAPSLCLHIRHCDQYIFFPEKIPSQHSLTQLSLGAGICTLLLHLNKCSKAVGRQGVIPICYLVYTLTKV